MKGLFLALILVVSCVAEPTEVEVPQANPIIEFVSGFLEGIHEVKSIEDLIKCMKNADEILARIKDGISLIIKGLKKLNVDTILKGFHAIFSAFFDLEKMIRPCLTGFKRFEALIAAFKNIDLLKLVFKILSNPGPIIEDLIDIFQSLEEGDYHQAGVDLGDLLERLFLTEFATAANPIVEFVNGLLKGIHETQKIEELLKCLKNADSILAKIKQALEKIKSMRSVEDLLEGLKMLFAAFMELEEMLKPCLEGFHQFKRLLKEIRHADVNKLIGKLLKQWPYFLAKIIDIIVAFSNGHFEKAGEGLGDIFYVLFLATTADALEGNPVIDFVTGFLQGIHETKTIEDLVKCMKNADKIIQQITDGVQLIIKGLKKLNVDTIMKGLNMIFDAIYDLEKMLLPCLKEYTQFIKLIQNIRKAQLLKIIFKILENPDAFIEDFTDLLESIENGDYLQAGSDLGDILYRLFLTDFLASNPIYDFVTGLLLGIKETKTIDDLLKCLKNADSILEKIKAALELIKGMKSLDDLLKGLKLLFNALMELENMLKPCLDGFEQFKKILKAIRHVDWAKLLQKIVSRWPYYLDDIIEAVIAFTKGNYQKAGKCLGDILYRMFIADSFGECPFHAFFKGFLVGIKEPKTLEDLFDCLKGALGLIVELKAALKELVKAIKALDIDKVIELAKKIALLAEKIFNSAYPCLQTFKQLVKLIIAIKNTDINKLFEKVMSNYAAYLKVLWTLLNQVLAKDWENSGKSFGELHFMLWLE